MFDPTKKHDLTKTLQAADKGDRKAMLEAVEILAVEGYSGGREDADIKERINGYLGKLVEAGDTDALIMLADRYAGGAMGRKDGGKALELYSQAVQLGEIYGNECMGAMYFFGRGVKQDYAKAFKYLKLNKRWSFQGKYILGEMYRQGLHVKKNLKKATDFFERIAYTDNPYDQKDSFFPCAQFRLAQLRRTEEDEDERDLEEAEELLQAAKARFAQERPIDKTITKKALLEETAALVQAIEDEPKQYVVEAVGPLSPKSFREKIEDVIPSLRDKAYEYLVADIKYDHPAGILFLQTVNSTDFYEVEMSRLVDSYAEGEPVFDEGGGRKSKLYRLNRENTGVQDAIDTFRTALVENRFPENEWIDMTWVCIPDSLLKPAIDLLVESGKATVARLQTKLKIGFDRALHLIEQIEELKIISEADAKGSRKVLVDKAEAERIFAEWKKEKEDGED